jgi:Ca2+-binding EF-hand superfamily protein
VGKQQVKSLEDYKGNIQFDVFSRVLAGPMLIQRQKALRAFELFDKDGKDFICVQDLQRVALELGETSMTELQLEAMIDDADVRGQGFLSRDDFLTLAESLDI